MFRLVCLDTSSIVLSLISIEIQFLQSLNRSLSCGVKCGCLGGGGGGGGRGTGREELEGGKQ